MSLIEKRGRRLRAQLRRPSIRREGTSDPAGRVRSEVLQLAAAQEGFVTLAQVARTHSPRIARAGLSSMTDHGELTEVSGNVWLHSVVNPSASNMDVEARAAWLAFEPGATVRERRQRFEDGEPLPVIGGGAAYLRWGFGYTPWPTYILHPAETAPPGDDGDVPFTAGPVDLDRVAWIGAFPYIGIEATLAGQFGFTVDLDDVAADLADALWRVRQVDREQFRQELEAVAVANDWVGTVMAGDRIYDELLVRAANWTPPSTVWGRSWKNNRAAADAAILRYHQTHSPDSWRTLWAGVVDDFRGPRPADTSSPE